MRQDTHKHSHTDANIRFHVTGKINILIALLNKGAICLEIAKISTNICRPVCGTEVSLVSREILLYKQQQIFTIFNLRPQIFMLLNCFCFFFIFTAFGNPLEELRKATDLKELSELSDSIEERSKNKTAVSADQEVS